VETVETCVPEFFPPRWLSLRQFCRCYIRARVQIGYDLSPWDAPEGGHSVVRRRSQERLVGFAGERVEAIECCSACGGAKLVNRFWVRFTKSPDY
jgi:hypothetical protein